MVNQAFFVGVMAMVFLGCGGTAKVAPGDNPDKPTCKSVSTTGVAKFEKLDKANLPSYETRATFTWTDADGTVLDTRGYDWIANDQCFADEHIIEGSNARVQIYVRCPVPPSSHTAVGVKATPPWGYSFPDFTSAACKP